MILSQIADSNLICIMANIVLLRIIEKRTFLFSWLIK